MYTLKTPFFVLQIITFFSSLIRGKGRDVVHYLLFNIKQGREHNYCVTVSANDSSVTSVSPKIQTIHT